MIEIIIILTISITIASILKLLNSRHNSKNFDVEDTVCCLITREPPYKKYKKVSKKASPPNSPQRTEGDFFDYIEYGFNTDKNAVENNLLEIYGESIYE